MVEGTGAWEVEGVGVVPIMVMSAMIIPFLSLSAPVAVNWSLKDLFPSTIVLMRMGTPILFSLARKSSVNSLPPFGVVKSTSVDRNQKQIVTLFVTQ